RRRVRRLHGQPGRARRGRNLCGSRPEGLPGSFGSPRRGLRLPGLRRRAGSLALFAGQTFERLALRSHVKPFVDDSGSEGLVKPDGRSVPVEDLPLEASAIVLDGNSRQMREEALADSLAAELLTHEE